MKNFRLYSRVAFSLAVVALWGASPVLAQKLSPADVAYKTAFTVWKNGNQREAERLLAKAVLKFPANEKIVFFYATCLRSRFEVDRAEPIFLHLLKVAYAKQSDETKFSVLSQCAMGIVAIDSERSSEVGFQLLQSIAQQKSADPIGIWLYAIACRTLDKNNEGVAAYRLLLSKASPGSALVHQTFANLLDKVGKHEEALNSRMMAVKLEPAPWSYDGLASTLGRMGRQEEGLAIHKYVNTSPDDPHGWNQLGFCLYIQKDYEGALDKYKHVEQLGKCDDRTYKMLYWTLHYLGREEEALAYKQKMQKPF